jgi:hypothetical protein
MGSQLFESAELDMICSVYCDSVRREWSEWSLPSIRQPLMLSAYAIA